MKRALILLAILAGLTMTSSSASALGGRRAYYRGYSRAYYYNTYRPYYGPGYYGAQRPYYRPYAGYYYSGY